ncbi:MAG TPA: hypothetical protein RMH99_01855 [Sandaracinaceae bacterium LLY-WYZ-13_1]|nr:hypothetical protein [Sandaracinaceae bacterium LLY-WYZ-13_1]
MRLDAIRPGAGLDASGWEGTTPRFTFTGPTSPMVVRAFRSASDAQWG